jgi:hypothetical protein
MSNAMILSAVDMLFPKKHEKINGWLRSEAVMSAVDGIVLFRLM